MRFNPIRLAWRKIWFRIEQRLRPIENALSNIQQKLQTAPSLAALNEISATLELLDRRVALMERTFIYRTEEIGQDLLLLKRQAHNLAEVAGELQRNQSAKDFAPKFDAITNEFRRRLIRLEQSLTSHRPVSGDGGKSTPTFQGASPPRDDFATFYANFEDRFRGPREDIKSRLEIYLPRLATNDERLLTKPILDLGCGRGEWLELLQENDILNSGVDGNEHFVSENNRRGLTTTFGDILAYLRAAPDNSARAVTAFHVIEHLPIHILLPLIRETYRVLDKGGIAIFETPNPENLQMAANAFYLDPTHRAPIPPALAIALFDMTGFSDMEILRLHESTDSNRDKVENPFLQNLLFGPQDYAILGRKSVSDGPVT